MKRSEQSQLEDESRSALKNWLSSKGWIARDIWERDIGIDMDVEIVEAGKVTNKRFWMQVRATESKGVTGGMVPLQMDTKHLEYYETQRLPVIIVYGVKKAEGNFDFYYLFAQKYIRGNLSIDNPSWREQKTVEVKFDSKLERVEDLNYLATEGYLYIAAQQLNISTPTGAQYWLNGIPKSDNEELKKRTLRALTFMTDEKYPAAIEEFDNILKTCTLSPTERMSIFLNLGNAYYSLSQTDNALRNYIAITELIKKVNEKDALEGMSAALGNIGLIYSAKGDLDNALKYHQDALKIDKEIGYKQGEAKQLGNIGLIYSAKGDLDNALKYHQDALKIHKEIGYKQGEANQLGNIGLIYKAKGDLDNALKYLRYAINTLDGFNLIYGRDIIQNAIDSITKNKRKTD